MLRGMFKTDGKLQYKNLGTPTAANKKRINPMNGFINNFLGKCFRDVWTKLWVSRHFQLATFRVVDV